MAAAAHLPVDASSPASRLNEESPLSTASMACASRSPLSNPIPSPSSDKRFWSALRTRVDTLLENRQSQFQSTYAQSIDGGGSSRAKRMKEDSMLLIRGFDSVSFSLSKLNSNLENALQGARDLAKLSTVTEISQPVENAEEEEGEEEKKGVKRKFEVHDSSSDQEDKENEQNQVNNKLKKAKNMAMSMAAKAAAMARELKSIKMDLSFMQERCALLEEENRRLRDGFSKGIRPEEDDLVRLQLEVLLAEKSRLANENSNLTRENQCLRQLLEYHQFNSRELSASYENLLQEVCLDFSSPQPAKEEYEDVEDGDDNQDLEQPPYTPRNVLEFSTSP